MSFPIYILDDDSIHYSNEDLDHSVFWKKQIAKYVAKMFKISLNEILDIPYCQRRGRIVGNKFYCGEKINKKLLNKIEKTIALKLEYIYDEHETRLIDDVIKLKSHINNNIFIF